MALDLSAVGSSTQPAEFKYTWKDVALYALGIGAKKSELEYVYEAKGPKVYPTFAVVPSFVPMGEVLSKTGGSLASILHGGQTVTVHRPIPSEGTLTTVATLDGIYDMKKMAQAIVKTRSELNGELVMETESSILYRGEGSFGGSPPPKADIPKPPDLDSPTFVHEETTTPEQALLYRLSGDLNPLHADPSFAKMVGFDEPILHGLCTYGYVGRAVAAEACDGDAGRIRSLTAQFRKPVWPGQKVITKGYKMDDGRIALRVYTDAAPEPVITNAWAVLTD